MTQKSYGAGVDRRPVHSGGRRVAGLYEWTRTDGTIGYGARVRLGGVQTRVVLDARNKLDAVAELAALRVDHRRGDPIRTRSVVPTLADVVEDWLAAMELRTRHRDPSKRRSPRTVALYRQQVGKHVLPTLGHRAIDDITVADLRRLVEKLGAKLAPSTVTSVIVMLSSLMRYAVRHRLIAHNPVRLLDRDDRPGVARQTEPRYLSVEEVEAVLAGMTDTFRPIAAACVYAGLRISEALGLHWEDVDFDAKTIHVHRQLDPDLTIRNVTKTAASTGTVPLLPALERELRAHRARQGGVDLRRTHGSRLVFTTSRGKPQSRRNALRAVGRAAEAAGLSPEGVQPVGLHDLRHSYVAMALDAGVTLAEAALLARHANAKVTAQVYAGLTEKAKAEVATKLVNAGVGS